MKKIIVLSLLALVLTGCVKQEDYDELVKDNANLESKVERLEEENEELRNEIEELKISPTPTETPVVETSIPEPIETIEMNLTPSDGELLFKSYESLETGDKIILSVEDEDDNRSLSIMYLPSEYYSDDPGKYELKCASFLAYATALAENNNYHINIVDSYLYCYVTYSGMDDGTAFVTSSDRNGTTHINQIDGKIADWITEAIDKADQIETIDIIVWIYDVSTRIKKDIEGIYP